jgi:hypothetical protein
MTAGAMPPDVETLRLLLILGREFASDDHLRFIVTMDEDAEDYWEAEQAGMCLSCKDARDAAIERQEAPEGLTLPEVYAIAWWRPVRDALDAWTFLAEHANCPRRPRLDIGIRWD